MPAITIRDFRHAGAIDDEPIIGLTPELGGSVAAYAGIRQVLAHNWAFFKLLDERAPRPALLHRTTLATLDAAEAPMRFLMVPETPCRRTSKPLASS